MLLAALHRQVLVGGYDKEASDLRRTLASGDFNCLSALVLYVELCRRAGIDLEIWSLPGHVFCRLAGPPEVRIEPTHRAGSSRAAQVASDARPRRITQAELLGRFYYNRGVEQLASQQFAGGVELLRIACQLDPADRDARSNLLAGLNNWALALCHADEPAAAARLIEIGLSLDPHFPPLKANAEYVRRRAIER